MAGAKLRDFLAPALLDYPVVEPTDRQFEFAEELEIDISNETRRTAKVMIKEHLFVQNQIALDKLKLRKGDSISYYNDQGQIIETRTISTIKSNGRLFFKGTDFRADYAARLLEKKIRITPHNN